MVGFQRREWTERCSCFLGTWISLCFFQLCMGLLRRILLHPHLMHHRDRAILFAEIFRFRFNTDWCGWSWHGCSPVLAACRQSAAREICLVYLTEGFLNQPGINVDVHIWQLNDRLYPGVSRNCFVWVPFNRLSHLVWLPSLTSLLEHRQFFEIKLRLALYWLY